MPLYLQLYNDSAMVPKFCISVPIGSYHPFLKHCLASLVAQVENAASYEVVIALLDASGDIRVTRIADEFDSMLAYRRHGPDEGQSAAILEGWEKCSGDVLGWLNADDILFPHALERAANVLAADPDVDVVYGHSTIIDDRFQTTGYHWAVEPPGPRLLEAGIISQPSCFFRRSAYDQAGGLNRNLHYTMDWDLWIRMYETGAQFAFIEEPLSMVLWGCNTKTASFNKARRQEISAITNNKLDSQSARRTFLAFAVHHVLERLKPAAFKRRIERLLTKGRNTINGIGGNGEMHDGASIALAHYSPKPVDSVTAKIDDVAAITDVSCPEMEISSWSRSQKRLAINFSRPVAAGDVITLSFSVDHARMPYLQSIQWAPPHEI